MYESHASYSACGLGSAGTDRIVQLARDAGPARGIHGAKITGGGSGGTVALLCDATAGDAVRTIAAQYAGEAGRRAHVFEGSSPGAARVGAIRLEPS
jgi:L-arabinokinase